VTATDLATTARKFMHGAAAEGARRRPNEVVVLGSWARAAALLARQALEQGLDDLWGAVSPRVREASRHAQLLCLGEFIRDEEVVNGARYAWHGLSRACHHQVYELSPTEAELSTWLDAVDRLVSHDPMRK
jgi:hypothetical protein